MDAAPATPTAEIDSRRRARATKRSHSVSESVFTDKLGKRIVTDTQIFRQYGLSYLLRLRSGTGDFGLLRRAREHPAYRVLHHYKHRGVPITLADQPWSPEELQASVDRGPHKSAYEYSSFLREDMADMADKGFWVVLPFEEVKNTPGLRLSPIGVVPQHARRPRPIVDYTFYGINEVTQPNAPMQAMQFGRAFDRLLRKILLANPRYGRVYLSKIDLADGFYRLQLPPDRAPQLGVVFPSGPGEPPLVAIPTRLPMGWCQSPPAFCAATETAADIANTDLLRQIKAPPHPLEHLAGHSRPPAHRPSQPTPPGLAVPIPTQPDPHLNHHRRRRVHYVDIYVDDFLAAAQGNAKARRNVHRVLMHAIDDIFRPLASDDPSTRKQPISVKKLRAGDAAWSTQKEVLGWLVDTQAMTLRLTQRRLQRLRTTLEQDFPRTRKRASVTDYHKLLGELRSLAIALPGARGLFSVLQEALRHTQPDSRLRLTEDIHNILDDFWDLHRTIEDRPVRIQELVPMMPTVHGAHDAAGHGAGGIILPTPTTVARREPLRTQTCSRRRPFAQPGPIVWRMPFPRDITNDLTTWDNPQGRLTNTDLELAGSVIQSFASTACFDLRERTALQRTDNLGTLFWQRKGSTTTVKPAARLLRLQAYHQRYHRHLLLHDYLPGCLNSAADDASRLQALSNAAFLRHFNSTYPQSLPWRLWTPPRALRSCVISALRNMPSPLESPLHKPALPTPTGPFGLTSAPNFPSIRFSKGSTTPWSTYKFSSTVSAPASLPPRPSSPCMLR